jgi:hypothetical protein
MYTDRVGRQGGGEVAGAPVRRVNRSVAASISRNVAIDSKLFEEYYSCCRLNAGSAKVLRAEGGTMAESRMSEYPPQEELVAIRERLREGKLTPEDIRALEKIVVSVEQASKALRAAMVE